MIKNSNEKVQRLAVSAINFLHGKSVNYQILNESFFWSYMFKDAAKENIMTKCLSKINLDAKTYSLMVNLNEKNQVYPQL